MASFDILLSVDQVSTRLTSRFSAGRDLDSFCRGLIDTYITKTEAEYGLYRRFMHDILCLALLEQGYYSDEEFTIQKFGIQTNDTSFNRYKPDLYQVDQDVIRVCDVAFTLDPANTKNQKLRKYNDYLLFMEKQLGKRISYVTVAVDLSDSEWDDHIPEIPGMYKIMLTRFVNNLRIIHSINPEFVSKTSKPYQTDRFTFESDKDHMNSIIEGITGYESGYDKLLTNVTKETSNAQDKDYLGTLASAVLNSKFKGRPRPRTGPVDVGLLVDEWAKYKSRPANTEKIPVILQLGLPNLTEEKEIPYEESVKILMESNSHGGYMDLIKHSLSSELPDDRKMINLYMSTSQLESEQRSGPGRKHYMKKHGIHDKRKPPTHIGIDVEHDRMVSDLMSVVDEPNASHYIKPMDLPEESTIGGAMMSTMMAIQVLLEESGTTFMLRFYQRVAQEIIINSMRRRKGKQYVLCYSGFEGVYFLIAPGAQLRTESNVIFIKFVSLCSPVVHQLSREWLSIGDHWESDWISVDTDRLKHWSRSFDRIVVSLMACSERLVEPGLKIVEAVRQEISSLNYSMMALFYLENKQTTSTSNQTMRYLWMKALGDKDYKGVMRKFPDRVSSTLQSMMLQRCIATILEMTKTDISNYLKIQQLIRDEELGTLDETSTGVLGKLPRLFTNGSFVPVSYNLNEIYWCMMYNKDRQNVTQDAMKILSKILKEEVKFDEEIHHRETPVDKFKYFSGLTTVDEDIRHSFTEKPESHYYSMRAVKLGAKLQDTHSENTCPNSTWLTETKLEEILGKNLAEYATFKASVKDIKRMVDVTDLDAISEIGKRTKCIELVYEIVKDENLRTASEVAMQFSGKNSDLFNIMIQIFKKNQVGGVREILILFIKARIMINIIEEICRLLSKADRREILTKGKDKRLIMRSDFEDLSSMFPKGTPIQMIKNSYDMSTWCQKFIPVIFSPIFARHFHNNPSMIDYCVFILVKHCDKQIEFPRKMVEQWSKHPEMEHEDPAIQSAKEKFLRTGETFFKNRSNMGQGILHYCSTVLALYAQSFRDALFSRCVDLLGSEKKIFWRTRVGSDDKGELIAINMTDAESYRQYLIFETCSHVAERLFAMELSVKSASGNIMYELNSAFMANLETLSPTIKFALATTDMMSTSSCSRFINESYSRIRQLRENGASSLVCGFAHMLNADHFHTVFRTGEDMVNDPRRVFNVPLSRIPYDFGVYPFYDVDLQDMVGPEYYNYLVYTDKRTEDGLLKLLYTDISNNVSDGQVLPNSDTPLFKKDHFGISQGLVKQLANMRKRLSLDPVEIFEYLKNNPFMIIRGPENIEETCKLIAAKLYTKGAAESLRRTSPAIYMGRLAAFESAKAWNLLAEDTNAMEENLNEEYDDESDGREFLKVTYREFLIESYNRVKDQPFHRDEIMHMIFPQNQSFEVVRQFVGKFGPRRENKKKHSQAIRIWTMNNYNYNFSNSLRGILETSFGYTQASSQDDVMELRKLINMDISSYESMIADCQDKDIRPLDLFYYMTKLFKNISTSKPQVFANGPSTSSLNLTLLNLKRFNHLPNTKMYLDEGIDHEVSHTENTIDKIMDTLKFAFNIKLMEEQEYFKGTDDILDLIQVRGMNLKDYCTTQVRNFKNISGFDNQTKKIILFLSAYLLEKDELKERLIRWKTLNFSYIKAQVKTISSNGKVTWSGDLKVLVNSGSDCFTLNQTQKGCWLETMRIQDLDSLLTNLSELCRILGIDFRMFFRRKRSNVGDIQLKSKKLSRCNVLGFQIDALKVFENENYQYLRFKDFSEFNIEKNIKKDQSVEIFLREGSGITSRKSAVICHFPGHYYPVPVPYDTVIDEDVWLMGVRLSKLMRNEEWFFNGRLPVMRESEVTEFLKEDVEMQIVMSSTGVNKTRMADYIAMHEEVNDELFGIENDQEHLMSSTGIAQEPLQGDIDMMNLGELFRKAMDEINTEHWIKPVTDWAEEVAEDYDLGMEEMMNQEDLNIRFARALGARKPTKRKNFFSISNLKQGSLLKTRILDLFFKSGSILAENKQDLTSYAIWLKTSTDIDPSLKDALETHIIDYLSYTTGASKSRLNNILTNSSPMLAKSIDRVIRYTIGPTPWDILNMNAAKYELEDSDAEMSESGSMDEYE